MEPPASMVYAAVFLTEFVDPEISQNYDPNGLFSYQQEGWPQFQRVSFTLRLTY